MVITKRYNSVERFTSVQLSSNNGENGGEELPAGGRPSSQLAIPQHLEHMQATPRPTWTDQQQRQMGHPVTLARRRSNEQLLQSPVGLPESSRPLPPSTSHSLSMTVAPQQPVGPSGPYAQQRQMPVPSMARQQPAYAQQQQQPVRQFQPMQPQQEKPQLQAQPRPILRPGNQPVPGQMPYPTPYGHGTRQSAATAPPSRQSMAGTPVQYVQKPSPRGTIATLDSHQQHAPPQHLADVYTGSQSDLELAENMGTFMSRKVPAPIWLTLSIVQIVAGLVSLFIGAFNASPYQCVIEPNIPVYLIISGILLIVNGGIRLFFWLTADKGKRRQRTTGQQQQEREGRRQQQRKRSGMQYRNLCEYASEGTVLFGIVVVVILGCVWVYGASRYMYNQRYYSSGYSSYSNYRYCDPTVYWTAWWSVTLHLGLFALLILAAIVLLIYGALIG